MDLLTSVFYVFFLLVNTMRLQLSQSPGKRHKDQDSGECLGGRAYRDGQQGGRTKGKNNNIPGPLTKNTTVIKLSFDHYETIDMEL